MTAIAKPRRRQFDHRAATERRDEARNTAHAPAWVTAEGYGTARCTVIDRSTVGAQINAPVGLSVGVEVLLALEGIQRRARVKWVEADRIGLRFIR